MKTKLLALGLIVSTIGAVLLYPKPGNSADAVNVDPGDPATLAQAPKIEVVFALDTTGSMSGLIDAAKEKIWSIANSMASAQSSPDIRIGLVAYRDRGDAYVTQITDLSQDLDSVYAKLMDYEANGGGDTPESVNAALAAAIDRVSWSDDAGTYRVVFLVGDAPPHMDYQDEPQYPEIMQQAVAKGIVVNTIRCGTNVHTERQWQQIAALANGSYFSVDQAGSAVAIATPFDTKLAELSRALDETRVAFGDAAARTQAELKAAATEKLHAIASEASRARRAAFNAMESGKKNLYGDHDLVKSVEEGVVDLEKVEVEHLPAPMQVMSPAERAAYVEEQAAKRKELNRQIEQAVASREAYIAEQVSEAEEDSLDYRIFDVVKEQAEAKGLRYDEAAAPKL